MDNKKTKKIKFNVLDLLIILLIVGVVAVFLFREGGILSDITNRSSQTIEYVVKINDIQKESYQYLKNDVVIYSEKEDKKIGSIYSVGEPEEVEMYVRDQRGNIVKAQKDDSRMSIEIVVRAKGTADEKGCMVSGNYFIASGKEIPCYTDKLSFNGMVMSVNVVDPS